ncbi:MAG: hypothetical protein E3J89_01940 [Candidatus Aminicenantes bacterium]|nr:MAG: hypothetical protein E3J89_01940 [Candidatus Aminicenantes bacterium]
MRKLILVVMIIVGATLVFGLAPAMADTPEEILVAVRELEKQDTSDGYHRARNLLLNLTNENPSLAAREQILYELVKIHCLHFKLALTCEDMFFEKRTLIQLDYGFMIYTFAEAYIHLHPEGRHSSLMQRMVSFWEEPPKPLPEEIEKKPFNPNEFHLERFMHGLKNFGKVGLLVNFLKTYDWEKHEREVNHS